MVIQSIFEYQTASILNVKFNCNILSLVNCATVNNGEIGFCYCNACSENKGDCDTHDECQDGLVCGTNNCLASLGFDSEVDCCYQPTLGDGEFCTTTTPCGEDEGDCDSHDECQDGLLCGSNNCPASHGIGSEVDCCTSTGKIRKLHELYLGYPVMSVLNYSCQMWWIRYNSGTLM